MKKPVRTLEDALLPDLPIEQIRACYADAPGNELESEKFFSLESSAALVANAFGFFLGKSEMLPALPGTSDMDWPALDIKLEAVLRFPWSGGRHPCLDALVQTKSALIGIESKRYEPFRSKSSAWISDAYSRSVWGENMTRYSRVLEDVRLATLRFSHLDAAQLVKHAFAIRTAVQEGATHAGLSPVLAYVYAEPANWADGSPVDSLAIERHRIEIGEFETAVRGDEVLFVSCSYAELLQTWENDRNNNVRMHAAKLTEQFSLQR